MRKRYLGLLIPAILLAVALPSIAGQPQPSARSILQTIQPCLPKAEVGEPYKLSVASYVKSQSNLWLLIRAYDNPLTAPNYSVVEVNKSTCKNYHKYPVVDISRTPLVPKSVLAKFSAVIKKDTDIAWGLLQKDIMSKNPGKSIQQLQKEGAFGLDGL